ncbi:MAG TPA: hypothetical protein VIE91_08380 [Methylophilaceae bacterium]|jgi:phenylacetate-CoA ligase
MNNPDQLRLLLGQLEQTQWRSSKDIQDWQLLRAHAVASFAAEQVPYYATLRPLLSSRPMIAEEWQALPLTTRSDIQLQDEQMLARQIPADQQPLGEVKTSGSTGSPLRAIATASTRLHWLANSMRDHLWHQRDFSGRLAAIRYVAKKGAMYPEGKVSTSWGIPASLLFKTGPGMSLNIQCDISQQIEWLRRQQPHYLLTYPSNAAELSLALAQPGKRVESLKELRLFGEVAEQELRGQCAERMGIPVTDMYSANEVGYIALQCREHGRYHIQAESLLVEIINEQGCQCEPGEIGRVVITTLQNFAMPLIRYSNGDYAVPGTPCPCGRGLPVIERILGRSRNMLTLPSGEKRWPSFGSSGFREVAPVLQCQLIQHSTGRLELRLVVERELVAEEEQKLRTKVLDALGQPFQIDISYHQQIERSPTWKFEEFKSLL